MSILARLTPGAPMKDPREGRGAGESEASVAEIGMAVGQLDWFTHALVMQQHCDQDPPNMAAVLNRIESLIVKAWMAGSGRAQISRERIEKMAGALWADFAMGYKLTDLERASLCGMSDRGFRSGPHEIYREVSAELASIASDGFRDVKRQLAK